jgi:hypothetical protein
MKQNLAELVRLSHFTPPRILPNPISCPDGAEEYYEASFDPNSSSGSLSDIPLIKSLLKRFPDSPFPWYLLSEVADDVDDFPAYLRLLAIRSTMEARLLGANAFCRGGMSEDNDHTDPFLEALTEQADATLEHGDISAARMLYERMLLLDPDDRFFVCGNLPAIYLAQDDIAELASLWERDVAQFHQAEFHLAFFAFGVQDSKKPTCSKALSELLNENQFIVSSLVGASSSPLDVDPEDLNLLVSAIQGPEYEAHDMLSRFKVASKALNPAVNVLRSIFPQELIPFPVSDCTHPDLSFSYSPVPVKKWWYLRDVIRNQWEVSP